MKIHNLTDRKVADRVLKEFKKIARSSDNTLDVTLGLYVNCREQGYAINDSYYVVKRKVAFAENRNSDDIVVYFGSSSDFESNTNIPSEEVYRNSRFFGVGQEAQAAQFVFDYLTK